MHTLFLQRTGVWFPSVMSDGSQLLTTLGLEVSDAPGHQHAYDTPYRDITIDKIKNSKIKSFKIKIPTVIK